MTRSTFMHGAFFGIDAAFFAIAGTLRGMHAAFFGIDGTLSGMHAAFFAIAATFFSMGAAFFATRLTCCDVVEAKAETGQRALSPACSFPESKTCFRAAAVTPAKPRMTSFRSETW